jgi:outer membrane protein
MVMLSRTVRAATFGLLAAPLLAHAQGSQGADIGHWLVRARTLHLDPGITDTIGLYVTVSPRRFTELDISWFLRPEWAVEYALTVPQAHSVQSAGFEVGQLRQLPPTLLLQYHVTNLAGGLVRPYVGVGVSYTLVDNLRFSPELASQLQATARNRSFALAIGAGLDVPLGRGWVFSIDVKRLQLKTDLNAIDPVFGEFKVRPVLTSAGLGYRF